MPPTAAASPFQPALVVLALLPAITGIGCSLDGTADSQLGIVELTITPRSGTLLIGELMQLHVSAIDDGGSVHAGFDPSWRSTDGAVARVDPFGIATGRRRGETFMLARYGGLRDSVPLTVVDSSEAARFITISPAIGSIMVGGTRQYSVVARDSLGRVLPGVMAHWSLTDSTLASITAQGLLTGLQAGSLWVQAQVGPVYGEVLLSIIAPAP